MVGFTIMGMPRTNITKKDWVDLLKVATNGLGVVAPDGTLYLETTYAQLDPHWTESLVYYFVHKWDKRAHADFGIDPVTTKVAGQLNHCHYG